MTSVPSPLPGGVCGRARLPELSESQSLPPGIIAAIAVRFKEHKTSITFYNSLMTPALFPQAHPPFFTLQLLYNSQL